MAHGTNGDGWPYTPGSTPPPSDEMKDLAAQMAADEANEGNYTAAAELQKLMPAMSSGPGQGVMHTGSDGLRYSGDPDAPTGPLTPGQVPCRVCQLDDRTRAASSPDDLLCNVCRANEPLRRRKQFRDALGGAAEKFFGIEPNTSLEETAEGSAELDLRRERVDTLMRLADLVEGHPLPYSLVNAAELPAPVGFIVAGPSTPKRLHKDGSRKIEVDWDEVVFQRLGADAAEELRACRAAGYEDWQLHALVPVPDEVVFEAGLGPSGVGCFPPAKDQGGSETGENPEADRG